MEPGGSLPYSQAPAIWPYPNSEQSSPCLPNPISWRFILIICSHLHLGHPSGSLSQVSPPKPCMHLSYLMLYPPHSCFYPTKSNLIGTIWTCSEIESTRGRTSERQVLLNIVFMLCNLERTRGVLSWVSFVSSNRNLDPAATIVLVAGLVCVAGGRRQSEQFQTGVIAVIVFFYSSCIAFVWSVSALKDKAYLSQVY